MQAGTAGERVRVIRHLLGLTQASLADITGLSQSLISQVEKGTKVASEDFLVAVAKGTSTPRSFFSVEPLDVPPGSLRFRKLSSANASDTKRVEALAGEAYRVLRELTAEAKMRAPSLPQETRDELSADDLELVADRTRQALLLDPDTPISNLTRACERAGIGVVPLTLTDAATGEPEEMVGHFGNSLWRSGRDAALIGYFTTGAGDRQRFTVAHELGHLVLHSERRSVEGPRAEDEANRFAGALLLPRSRAVELFSDETTLREFANLKARWGVSIQALIMRGFQLGVISADRRTSLFKQISSRGWRRQEPVVVHHEEPQLLRKLVERKFGEKREPGKLSSSLRLGGITVQSLIPRPSSSDRQSESSVYQFRSRQTKDLARRENDPQTEEC